MIGVNRTQSHNGADEAGHLKTILAGLGQHLESLSNDTDMIAGALEEGSGAISRLDTQVSSLEATAVKALTLPARRQQGATGQ